MSKCCELDNIKKDTESVMETAESCGHRNVEGVGYFSFGKHGESQFGEFPWTIAVLKKILIGENNINLFLSGGSLIHPEVVLTTAHNVENASVNDLIVRAGEWNTKSTEEFLKHKDIQVQGVVKHGSFIRKNLFNNIALLFLEERFEFAPHINVICMPQRDYPIPLERCVASGWGKDKVSCGKI